MLFRSVVVAAGVTRGALIAVAMAVIPAGAATVTTATVASTAVAAAAFCATEIGRASSRDSVTTAVAKGHITNDTNRQ